MPLQKLKLNIFSLILIANMINTNLVSILMPVYNGFPDIKYSITSLLWQTYTHWECIIVNDGSTDGTKEFLDSLKEPRFKIIHLKRNAGRGNARQVALEYAQGQFIAYLDADDWWAPDKLEKQIQYLSCHPDVDLVSTGFYSYGVIKKIRRVRGVGNGIPRLFVKSKDKLCVACASVMIRRKTVADHAYNLNIDYGEDIDFFSRCMDGHKYANLADIHYYYSEFDSMSIVKLKRAYKEIYSREKTLKTLLKYFYYLFIAPILGIDFIIKHRGNISTEQQNRVFETLFEKLKIETEKNDLFLR